MKLLVAIKRVIDYKTSIRVKADGSGVEALNVKMVINPFDEIALEEALRIKEQGLAREIIVVSIGGDTHQEILRTALAMGADRAILIKTDQLIEPLACAKILAVIAKQEEVGMVLLGKQAIDTDHNQTGQMLAGLLHWPQGTFASKLDFHDDGLSVTREIDGGLETLFLTLPAVITTDLRLNEPRYLTLPNIMKAKSKPLLAIPFEDLRVNITPHLNILCVEAPALHRVGIRLNNTAELAARLKQETETLP